MMETRTICASNFFKFNVADGREGDQGRTRRAKPLFLKVVRGEIPSVMRARHAAKVCLRSEPL